MPTYASVPTRTLLVAVHPRGGWSTADKGTPDSFGCDFKFEITDDGKQNYLLIHASLDGKLFADTWHETLEDAYKCAEEAFGISGNEWCR